MQRGAVGMELFHEWKCWGKRKMAGKAAKMWEMETEASTQLGPVQSKTQRGWWCWHGEMRTREKGDGIRGE